MSRAAPLWIVVLVASIAGCNAQNLRFYEIIRTRTEECSIRPNGEFCKEPEQFDPPVTEVWSIEARPDAVFLYVDDETWLLDEMPEGSDSRTPRTGTRTTVVTRTPGPCTSTTQRSVSIVFDDVALSGSYAESTRLDGALSCGETPVGQRFADDVAGAVGAP